METLSRVVGAITGSTAISAAVAIISIWVCWLDRTDKSMVWKASCAMGVLGILGIVFTIREELASQDAAAAAAKELKQSNDRVAELLEVNKAMARKMDSRTDILTYEARQRITAILAKFPAKSVGIVKNNDTPESMEFANVIQEMLRQAGCLGSIAEVEGTSMNLNAPGRLVLKPFSADGEVAARSLAAALSEEGIPDVTVDSTGGPSVMRMSKFLQITIKPK